MKINHIECSNFKSFKELTVDLTDFNVVIGTNGSGKSNFLMLFKFIRDMMASDVTTAIANQGGATYIKNIFSMPDEQFFTLKFSLQTIHNVSFDSIIDKKNIKLNIKEISFDLCIKLGKTDTDFTVIKDIIKINFEYFDDKIKIGNSDLLASVTDNKFTVELINYDSTDYDIKQIFPNIQDFRNTVPDNKDILFNSILEALFKIDKTNNTLQHISIYEFEQDLLSSIKSQSNALDENDSREVFFALLSTVLKDDDKRRTFFNLLNYVLPDIDDIKFETEDTLSNIFLVKERYNGRYIPASLLSDGTVFMIVIILALYFDNKYLTIFDEPERRIHPHIISKLIDMMKDVSHNKQIILSTHNAEIVKYSGIDSIILIHRDNEGNSILSRPNEKEEINIFMMNEIGLDELFVQNMLLI